MPFNHLDDDAAALRNGCEAELDFSLLFCMTMGWGRQARPGRPPALIDSPATRTTSSPHPSQRLQKHIARGTVGWPIVSSPSLGLSSCQLVSVRRRHLRVVALSGS